MTLYEERSQLVAHLFTFFPIHPNPGQLQALRFVVSVVAAHHCEYRANSPGCSWDVTLDT